MPGEFVKKEELGKEVERPELFKHQPYYRRKGKRFNESLAGLILLIKPGPPESWAKNVPNISRCDRAHVVMLVEEGIIPRPEGIELLKALREFDKGNAIEKRLDVGGGIFSGEDYLIQKFGEEVGGLIHLGRSTGDLTTGNLRMAMRTSLIEILEGAIKYRETLVNLAEKHIETPFPTYTGWQEAQITSFAHYLLDFLYKTGYACKRIKETYQAVNQSPMGGAIGTGSDFPLNRERLAELLGFDGVITNTHEAISSENKTFVIETFNSLMLLLCPIEKLCGSLWLFQSNEFDMIRIADRFCGTSSIMPQKRNPLGLHFVSERVHNVYSLLFRHLLDESALMSWPRGGAISTAIEDTKLTLIAATEVTATVKVREHKVREHLMTNWTCATDLAAALVREANLSWRTAHQIVSILCRHAEERNIPAKALNNEMIEEASMEHMGKLVRLKESTIKSILDPLERIKARTLTGGPAPQNVKKQIEEIKQGLEVDGEFVRYSRKKLEDADKKLDKAIDNIF